MVRSELPSAVPFLYSPSLAMRHQTAKPKDLTLVQRFIFGLLELGFIATGVINVVRGRLHYLPIGARPSSSPF